MKKVLSSISFLFILFISCEKDSENTNDIFGRWEWIKTYSGWVETEITPESTRTNIILEFNRDFIFRSYQNDSLFSEESFHIISSEIINENEVKKTIQFDNIVLIHCSIMNQNILTTSTDMIDSPFSEFKRIK